MHQTSGAIGAHLAHLTQKLGFIGKVRKCKDLGKLRVWIRKEIRK